jgi:hypothetical protein
MSTILHIGEYLDIYETNNLTYLHGSSVSKKMF